MYVKYSPFFIDKYTENSQEFSGGLEVVELSRSWTNTDVIFNESTDNFYLPKISVDNVGNLHFVWYDDTNYSGAGTDADIFYRQWNAVNQTWLPIEVVSFQHNGTSYLPSIAADADGNIHLAWVDNTNYNNSGSDFDVFYKRLNNTSGDWTETVVVSNKSITSGSFDSQIAVDPHGNAHVIWSDGMNYNGTGPDSDIFYRGWNKSTDTWTITQVVSTESNSSSSNPSVAMDSNGTVHVVWWELTGSFHDVFYKYRNATTNLWSNVELLTTERLGEITPPEIAVDKAGHVHVVWSEESEYGSSGSDGDIFYKRWNVTVGNWTITEVISTKSVLYSCQQAIITDHCGNVHLAWRDSSDIEGAGPDNDVFYKFWNATTGIWTFMELISTESTSFSWNPTIAVDKFGYIYIAWEDATDYNGAGTDFDIFYKRTVDLQIAPVLSTILPNPNLDGNITLNWSTVENATMYYIFRDLSLFTSIGGRTPIGATPQTNYTNTGLMSGTYYYAVVASNATHNSSLSNCESVLVQLPDTQAPQYSNAVEGRSSPQNYAPNQLYQFNLTITDDVGLGTVFLEWNGTNSTVSTHAGDEYYHELGDLGAGSYQYRWVFNDTSNNWNATLLKPYIVNKINPDMELLLNGTPANYQTNGTWYCNLTITFPLADTVYLYLNESLMDSGLAPLVNVSQFNQLGVYNVTAWYPGGANYSAVKLTRWLTVVDGIPPGPCTINITIPYPPNFVLESSSFTLWGGTDVGSGISAYQYQIDTGGWISGTNFSLVGWANGPHVITYRVVDAAGNNGTIQNLTIFLLANTADYDQDGLTNQAELTQYGTDLFDPDTDGDGILDGTEVAQGSNPLDSNSPLLERVLIISLIIGSVAIPSTVFLLIRSRTGKRHH